MTQELFKDKYPDLEFVKTDKSHKVINVSTGKAIIWVTANNHNVGVGQLPSIELVADFIELMRVELPIW